MVLAWISVVFIFYRLLQRIASVRHRPLPAVGNPHDDGHDDCGPIHGKLLHLTSFPSLSRR